MSTKNIRGNTFSLTSLDLDFEGFTLLGGTGLGISEKLEPGAVPGASSWPIGWTKGKGSGTVKFNAPLKEALLLLKAMGSPFGARYASGSATFTEAEGDGVVTIEFDARVSSLDLDGGDEQKPSTIAFEGVLTGPCSWDGEVMVDDGDSFNIVDGVLSILGG